jgi:hypothetical protein
MLRTPPTTHCTANTRQNQNTAEAADEVPEGSRLRQNNPTDKAHNEPAKRTCNDLQISAPPANKYDKAS